MNNNLIFSSFLSIFFHAMFFAINPNPILTKNFDIDVLKGPSSLEISIISQTPLVQIKATKIKEDTLGEIKEEKYEAKKEVSENQEIQSIEARPMIGAITEQISTLMVNKPPTYPSLARIKGWEGEVLLLASLDKSGKVDGIRVLSTSGFYILDQAAVTAIRKWQFRGVNQPQDIKIPVRFVLTSK